MDAQTFLDNFRTVAEAPGGIDRLRDMVLDLAVRGRLVPQRESEGIASELVAKLESERRRNSTRTVDPLVDDEAPFTVPPTWAWVRLPTVSSDLGQGVPTRSFTYIDVGSIDNRAGSVGEATVLTPQEAPSRARKSVTRGSVVYSTVRPYLRNIAVVDRDFDPPPIASTAFAVYTPLPGVLPIWVCHCLRSPYFTSYVEAHQKGIAYPAISDADMRRAPLPLPPTGEQERIVAKVDELMRLCDDLEERQQTRREIAARARASSLKALERADTARGLHTAWSRVRMHWPSLTSHPEGVRALRGTILELAIRGRLSRQDPGEEQAPSLVARILQQRRELVAEGRFKKSAQSPLVSNEPFEIPEAWAWVRLGSVALEMRYGTSAKSEPDGAVPVLRMGNLQSGEIDWTNLKYTSDEAEIAKYHLDAPAVLFNRTNSKELVGKTAIYRGERQAIFAGYLIHIRCPVGLDPEYLNLVLNSPMAKSWCWTTKTDGISQSNISGSKLADFPLPLAPLEEQRRIVSRVTQLLDQCARLTTAIDARDESAAQLASAALVARRS